MHENLQPLSFKSSREFAVIPIASKILSLVIIPFILVSAFSAFRILHDLEVWIESDKSDPVEMFK